MMTRMVRVMRVRTATRMMSEQIRKVQKGGEIRDMDACVR
jgi:hypothetical protein